MQSYCPIFLLPQLPLTGTEAPGSGQGKWDGGVLVAPSVVARP